MKPASIVAALLIGVMSTIAATAHVLVTRDVYLMGTRAHLATYAATRDAGLTTLESALRVLEETEAELSTWREDSAISRLNRHPVGAPWPAGPTLCQMFTAVYDWQAATAGAFDPAIGRLTGAWDIHGTGRIPSAEALTAARAASGMARLAFDRPGCTLTRRADVALDVGAFGKGEALDRVETALGSGPWMISLGGQVSTGGPAPDDSPWTIEVAHPLERHRPHLRLLVREGSLSTSAGSERDLQVDGTRVAHHLDPRTGRPATFTGSVTVWHRRGLAADALSTALYVMGPEEGMRWADAHGLAAGYLIPERGKVRLEATRAFRALIAPE